VTNFPFLYRYVDGENRPAGELLCLDTRPTPEEPSLDTLGDEQPLIYEQGESVPI